MAATIASGAEQFGVISNHAFAVLGFSQGRVRLRNPHGGAGATSTISVADFGQAFQAMVQAL